MGSNLVGVNDLQVLYEEMNDIFGYKLLTVLCACNVY